MKSNKKGKIVIGLIFVLIGCAFLFEKLFGWWFNSKFVWPAIIIVIGIYLIFKGLKD